MSKKNSKSLNEIKLEAQKTGDKDTVTLIDRFKNLLAEVFKK